MTLFKGQAYSPPHLMQYCHTAPTIATENRVTDLLQREVLVVELEDEVEVGGRVTVLDVGRDGVLVVPDPLEVDGRLPLRLRRTGTSTSAACNRT